MTDLDTYLKTLEDAGIPLLGSFVIYSVRGGSVTPEDLRQWFAELGLDEKFLPPPQGAVHAFEKATGRDAKKKYSLDDRPTTRQRRGAPGAMGKEATLMVRHVARGKDMVVRHLVREVRDAGATRLSYDTHLADIRFHYTPDAGMWAGELHTVPSANIAALPEGEQATVAEMLANIESGYQDRCIHVSADKLRGCVRDYVKSLNPVCIRAGVYFVHNQHAGTLASLRELVARFGPGSSMSLTPLPDIGEMRETVVSAFMEETAGELDKLAAEIAKATAKGDASATAVLALNRRREELKASAAEHCLLLSTSLEDMEAKIGDVDLQLRSLLMSAGSDEDEDDTGTESDGPAGDGEE